MRLIDANASCGNCNWHTYGKNSMGNSAQHHYRTGHGVVVELIYEHCFFEDKHRKKKGVPK